jgi:excinuclease UvrABC nuclease subunit
VPQTLHDLLPGRADFEPSGDFDSFRKSAPAKWVVYLMTDVNDRPVQLLCVKNLRYSIERRLAAHEQVEPPATRRINYREIVRRIHWRRVDSAFEADLIYLEAARLAFPQSYQEMVGFRQAWFVHVDPDSKFPRYVKTTDLGNRTGTYVGPFEDRNAAAKLIEQVEDWFDLCRYYNVLVESPRGKPCAYKEMGKCPAPCDGTISLEQYRRLVDLSLSTLIDPREMIRLQESRMKQAAAELKFESAAKIRAYIEQLSQVGTGSYRFARRLSEFVYLSFQPGPRDGTAKVFLITPGQVEEIAGMVQEPPRPAELLRLAFTLAADRTGVMSALAMASLPPPPPVIDEAGAERIGLVTRHLFMTKQSRGIFLALESLDENAVVRAYREVQKHKSATPDEQDEGVLKELAAP